MQNYLRICLSVCIPKSYLFKEISILVGIKFVNFHQIKFVFIPFALDSRCKHEQLKKFF